MEILMVISPVLRPLVDNRESIRVKGDTVKDCLDSLAQTFPETRKWVFDVNNHPAIWVLLNGAIVLPGELDRRVQQGDEINLIPLVSGG